MDETQKETKNPSYATNSLYSIDNFIKLYRQIVLIN